MPRPALVGRARELARLDGAYAAARAGRGSLVLVTGEPGIGKTSLVEAAIEAARPEPATLWGSCRDGTGVPGLWPWAEIVRSAREQGLFTGEGDLLIEHSPSTPGAGPDRLRLFDALSRRLRRLADDHPVVVVLDDLQWAGAGSLRLLNFLAADLARSRLLVVATLRDGADVWADTGADDDADDRASVSEALARVVSRATTVSLGPLTEDEVAHLIRRIVPERATAERVGALYRRCGGNPLLVREVSQAADPERLPAGVRDLIRDRLARLPRDAVEVLELAAVAGREVATPILRRAGGVAPPALARAIDAAVAAGCVHLAEPGMIRFAHDLFREVLYLDLDSLTRANLHARIAEALEALVAPGTPGLAADLARHLVQAAWLGDPAQPLPYLRRAADEAGARLAFEEAAGHLSEGARLASLAGQPATRRAMLLDLADAHRRAGDLNEARAGYLDAADDARRAGDADGLARAALGLHAIGSETWTPHATEIGLLEEALAAHGAAADEAAVTKAPAEGATVASLLAALAEECVHGSPDAGRARWASERAVAIARRDGSPATLGTCLMALHDAVWWPGSAPRRLEILEEVAAIGDRAGVPMLAWQACFGRFVALLERADPRAYAELERADRLAADLGDPHLRWVVRSRRAVIALLTGRLPDAEAMIQRVGTDAQRLGEPDGRNVVGDLAAQLAAVRGTLEDLRRMWSQADLHPLVTATIEASAALERRDPAEAMDRLRPWVEVALTGSLGWQRLGHLALIGRASAAAGDLRLAARAYEELLPHAGDLVVTGGAVGVAGPVSLYLGVCAAGLGNVAEALAHLERAAEQAARLDARPWVAWAQAEAGRVRLERAAGDDRPVAEGLLRAAAATADDIGMAGLARRARDLLEAPAAPQCVFRRVDDVWTLGFDGEVVQMPDAKGLRDIARLLATPGREVPAATLVGEPAAGAEAALGADPVLDDVARRSYRRRLDELAAAVTDAEAAGDAERSDRLRAERQELVAALSAAYGLGGRSRRLGDGAERARKAVTARIRDTLGRIEQRHPPLGRHLRESIVTGTACCYRPTRDVQWLL